MEGQYTLDELKRMGNITSTVNQLLDGLITRQVGYTVNYYQLCSNGKWNNYDCKTKY